MSEVALGYATLPQTRNSHIIAFRSPIRGSYACTHDCLSDEKGSVSSRTWPSKLVLGQVQQSQSRLKRAAVHAASRFLQVPRPSQLSQRLQNLPKQSSNIRKACQSSGPPYDSASHASLLLQRCDTCDERAAGNLSHLRHCSILQLECHGSWCSSLRLRRRIIHEPDAQLVARV